MRTECHVKCLSLELFNLFKISDLPKRKHETVAVNMLDAIIKIACSNTKELFIADPTVIANN